MAISKKTREEVYRKYDGHCAYCGREIAYKDELLRQQKRHMGEYLHDLEIRAEIEGVEL